MIDLVSLKTRFFSALVAGPVSLAMIIYGGWPFKILMALAFGLAVREWVRMSWGEHNSSIISKVRDVLLGVAYIFMSFFAFMELRLGWEVGVFLSLFLAFGVWGGDIGAYFAGKFIGGPKMAPSISPNKTWAGLLGAVLGAFIMVCIVNYGMPQIPFEYQRQLFFPFFNLPLLVFLALLFAVLGQIGDLLISSYKRRAHRKDTGTLIPGHGGLLDRIDSLLFVSPAFFIFMLEYIGYGLGGDGGHGHVH
ncbi:MAG: phosphatidate cytidylyltransferase [Alphaproteobacteria bacterium]|nr:phosphatidate cytidylyltransferase [Alphaproteobacteria bacterium]